MDLKRVGHELGVRYVLEGSVRKAGQRARITGQLIDAATGAHLWANRFDGSLDDIFELQDKVASSVAGTIDPTWQAIEATRSAARPTADQTAYDLYLRAWAAVCCVRLIWEQRSEDRAVDRLRAEQFARRAMDVANDDPARCSDCAACLASAPSAVDLPTTTRQR